MTGTHGDYVMASKRSRPKPRRAPWDLRFCTRLARLMRFVVLRFWYFDETYGKARSFVLAEIGGRVGPATLADRTAKCGACHWRAAKAGVEYCFAPGDCGCPKSRWWPPGHLRHQLTLREFRCPLRKRDGRRWFDREGSDLSRRPPPSKEESSPIEA